MIDDSFIKQLKKYIPNNKKILLALSGGLDSVVLLHLLNSIKSKLFLEIHILHINYNSQSNSKKSEYLCEKLSKIYNNKLLVKQCNAFINNFEHNARIFRYKILNNYADINNINVILTAHHKDDQIETLYMKYKNNSDWISMVGIRDEIFKIKRPLLEVNKNSLYKYAMKNKLEWVEDLSNCNHKYLRNKIRHVSLPNEKKHNPNIENQLLGISLKNKKRYKCLLNDINVNYYKYIKKINNSNLLIENNIIKKFNYVELKLFYQVLINKELLINISSTKSHWINLYKFIQTAMPGSIFYINSKIIILMNRNSHYLCENKYYEKLKKLKNNKRIKVDTFPIVWNSNSLIEENDEEFNVLISESIEHLYIRHWQPGDSCFIPYYKRYVKVKKLFINNKIPIFEKLCIPIFVDSHDEIISIPDIYNLDANSRCIKINWKNNYLG